MRKEAITFIVVVLLLGGLTAWSFLDSGSTGTGRGRGKSADQGAELQKASSTPGRFLGDSDVTWAPDGRNIFETPSETRELPPLELGAPPLTRLIHPGVPLPVTLSPKARRAMRRAIVVDPKLAEAAGSTAAAPQPSETPGGNAGDRVNAVEAAKAALEKELEEANKKATQQESDADRKKRLDKITFTNGSTLFGEFSVAKALNRYQVKHDFDAVRTNVELSELDRTDRLKKFDLNFAEDKKGRLGKAVKYTGDVVSEIVLADTPKNRYSMKILDTGATDLPGQTELGRGLMEARLFDLAAEHFEKMRKAGLSSVELFTAQSDCRHELFDYNRELETLKTGLQAFPESAPLFSRLGRLQVTLGLPLEAKASFETALAKNPNDFVANVGLGDILRSMGKNTEAMVPLKEAVNLAGQDAIKTDLARLALGRTYLAAGDFKNAHETVDLVLQRAASGSPDRSRLHEQALVLTIVAALAQGQVAEAKTRVDEGVAAHPLSGALVYLSGVVALQQNDAVTARQRFNSALELDPLLTGEARVAQSMVDELSGNDAAAAASAATGATVAAPTTLELRAVYGRALLNIGDTAQARKELLKALDREPDNADVVVALGDCAYAEGNFPDAIRFYDRAAALDPDFPDLLARRIITQVRRRKLAEAEDLVGKIPTARSKDPLNVGAQAFFQYTKGNQVEALKILAKLGELDSGAAGMIGPYAKSAHDAIVAHQNKLMWTDSFSRTGSVLGRKWEKDVHSGINVALKDQAATFDGKQGTESDKPTLLWQEIPGDRFASFAVDLDMQAQPGVYSGLSLICFSVGVKVAEKWPGYQERGNNMAPFAGLQVALAPEGALVFRVLQKAKMSEWKPVTGTTYAGGPCTMEIRFSDPREGIVDVYVNRERVLTQQIDDLKRWKRTMDLQVFAQAQIDKRVHLTADNVTIVTYKEPK